MKNNQNFDDISLLRSTINCLPPHIVGGSLSLSDTSIKDNINLLVDDLASRSHTLDNEALVELTAIPLAK